MMAASSTALRPPPPDWFFRRVADYAGLRLVSLVQETMQPETVDLWLVKPSDSRRT